MAPAVARAMTGWVTTAAQAVVEAKGKVLPALRGIWPTRSRLMAPSWSTQWLRGVLVRWITLPKAIPAVHVHEAPPAMPVVAEPMVLRLAPTTTSTTPAAEAAVTMPPVAWAAGPGTTRWSTAGAEAAVAMWAPPLSTAFSSAAAAALVAPMTALPITMPMATTALLARTRAGAALPALRAAASSSCVRRALPALV